MGSYRSSARHLPPKCDVFNWHLRDVFGRPAGPADEAGRTNKSGVSDAPQGKSNSLPITSVSSTIKAVSCPT